MLLTWLWLLPAILSLVVWTLPARDLPKLPRAASVLFSFLILVYALRLYYPYSSQTGVLRLEETFGAGAFGIQYRLGVDGIGLSLCWLTALLTFLALAASGLREDLPAGFWAAFLALEAALMGVFTAQNLFYFYIFWDVALIPMFLIIGLWGSSNRRFAATKFILYTFVGSLFLLIGLIALAGLHERATGVWTWDIPALAKTPIDPSSAQWIFAAMALGFAVKIPVWPLHNWLPDAHTEAPAAGSVMLAGSMLKMGVYGFLHILVPIFPKLSFEALPWIGALGVVNILYGAACALAQKDLKRLVAYTSISHLGFCLVGLFSLTAEGIAGGSLQMINHGLSTGALFLLVGMIYERAHKRGIEDFGALATTAPWLTFFFAFALLSSIGMPGLNGFVGELMSLAGLAKAAPRLAVLALGGGVLAAAYGLPTFQKVFWQPRGPASVSSLVSDLGRAEKGVLWSLSALILWLGLYPAPLLRLFEPTVRSLTAR
ncbi:MAG: NADH-quinone oxidoreductase subunit M [Elusimicrobia bacterium]|nr:NADH-quinone oxidoreductase subunit M [Elusimicrobiota bacterium]